MRLPSKAARRYAAAGYGFAADVGYLDRLREDLAALAIVLAEVPDLPLFLANYLMPQATRQRVLGDVLVRRVHSVTGVLLRFLESKRRLALLGEVCAAFRELDETRQGLVRGHLKTAWPIEDAAAARVAARLTERLGARVVLTTGADPGLLGGFQVQVRDTVYDASVAARLRMARQALMGAGAQGVTRGG